MYYLVYSGFAVRVELLTWHCTSPRGADKKRVRTRYVGLAAFQAEQSLAEAGAIKGARVVAEIRCAQQFQEKSE